MAQLTRDQAIKWNDGNLNGFMFDISYYLTHGEKTSTKHIKIDDSHVLTVQIMYRSEYETKSNEYGCKWSMETGNQIPCVHFAYAVKSGSMLVSHGLGYWHNMGDARALANMISQFMQ